MLVKSLQKKKLPDDPGVYLFKQGKSVLYVGKATSLKDRVRSYFGADLIQTRGSLLVDMVYKADKIDFIKTDSVLEAIILEVNLIKKYQPKYNTKEKDNKSFNYVVITKEEWPRILVIRGRELFQSQEKSFVSIFGPFPNSTQLKEALKIVRKIFPFRDRCVPLSGKPCFNKQIGLCPGVCDGSISKVDYKKNIKNIQLFFEGKKKLILKSLEKEMKLFAKTGEFEKAAMIRNKIFALNHIQDVALIREEHTTSSSECHSSLTKEEMPPSEIKRLKSPPILRRSTESARGGGVRIEAYDAAHLSGTNNVGVMVVMENGEFKKSDYRKFKIRNSKGDDVHALQEILERRLKHIEWPSPNLIVVDGGLTQLNIAKKIIDQGLTLVQIVSVTKNDKHKPKAIIGNVEFIKKYQKQILLINNEAHRFAISFHRQQRSVIL